MHVRHPCSDYSHLLRLINCRFMIIIMIVMMIIIIYNTLAL